MTDRRWCWALFALAVLPRLAAAAWLGDALQFEDEALYSDTALRLLATGHFTASYPREPGYPVLLALFAAVLPPGVVFLRVAQAVVCGAGAVLTFAVGRRLFGRAAGLVAAVLYALDPLMIVSGALLYSEATAAVLLLLALLAAVHTRRADRLWAAAAAGALLAVMALFRPVAMAILPPVALWTAFGPRLSRRGAQRAAVLGVCYLAALAPWTYRNYVVRGGFVPISDSGRQNAFALAQPELECREEAMSRLGQVDTFSFSRAEVARTGLAASILHVAWERPGPLLRHVAEHFQHFWELYPTRLMTDQPELLAQMRATDPRLPEHLRFPRGLRDRVSAVTYGVELALALVGLVLAGRRHPSETRLLLGAVLAFAFGYALFVGKLRYRIPVLPELFLFSGVTAAALLHLGVVPQRVRGLLAAAPARGFAPRRGAPLEDDVQV